MDKKYDLKNIPLGLSNAFNQNAAAITVFENFDDGKKQEVIEKASSVKNKKEMTALVQSIATNSI